MANIVKSIIATYGFTSILLLIMVVYFLDRWSQFTTHRQRTVETMVEKFHDYVEDHYMPTITSIKALLHYIGTSWEESGEFNYLGKGRREQSFFHLHHYLSRRALWSEKVGGTFFKDITAEKVVNRLTREAFDCLGLDHGGFLAPQELSRLQNVGNVNKPFYKFANQLETDEKTKALYAKFDNWLNISAHSAKTLFIYLRAISEVVSLEINVPYRPWYQKGLRFFYRMPVSIRLVTYVVVRDEMEDLWSNKKEKARYLKHLAKHLAP